MNRTKAYLPPLLATVAFVATAAVAHATATPVGPLPVGPTISTMTKSGQLVAVALPHTRRNAGYTWRIARRYDTHVVKEISEADVGNSVVVVFKVTGRGDTSIVFGLTRGDASPKAVQSYTHRIHAR